MRLLIVSHTPHYLKSKTLVGWGPTVREIDHLASLFDEVVHIAPLHSGAPESALAYESSNVQFLPVPPSGGERLFEKLSVLARVPLYARTILKELSRADVVHVRCPANISLLAIVLLAMVRRPRLRWVKYAGNWSPESGEAWSYDLQRWWLRRRLHRGVVTVNGHWPGQPKHINAFLNPCLTEQELVEARHIAAEKELSSSPRLIYVGRLEKTKGTERVLRILALLKSSGLSLKLDLIGDGPQRQEFEDLAESLGVSSLASFHGWLPRTGLAPLYAQAHIMLFPSNCSEGWPKVLSEAMAYGVVPLSSRVSSIPQYLGRFGTGRTFEPNDVEGFANAVVAYCSQPAKWKEESINAVKAARLFTYQNYLEAVRSLLAATVGCSVERPAISEAGIAIGNTEKINLPS
jgi:glycosyltransferase involved in cell wall biosynthesis